MMFSRSSKQAVLRRFSPLRVLPTLALILSCLVISASANHPVYEGPYNIHDAVAYANQYAFSFNSKYEIAYAVVELPDGKRAMEEDCTNFTSQCLIAGGIPTNESWTDDSSHWGWFDEDIADYYDATIMRTIHHKYSKGYNTFVNAGLFNQYCIDQGYLVEKSVSTNGNTLISHALSPAVGDIIQFDWDGNGIIDHSMICCGFTDNGEPCFAGHSQGAYMLPFSQLKSIQPFTYAPAFGSASGTVVYLIHMTDTTGLTDVTNRYQEGQIVTIKSRKVNQYVSADTDQRGAAVNAVANRNTASTWEYYEIRKTSYGELGFRALSNGNYLSTRVDLDSASAPLQATVGWDYSEPLSWESFRVFEKDGIQYLQSQANGKWVQVNADDPAYPVRAAGRAAGTWEQFSLEIVSTPVTADAPTVSAPAQTLPTPSSGTATEPPADTQPADNMVYQKYYSNGYNEGYYTGEWDSVSGRPNGKGTLEYKDVNGDNLFYTISFGSHVYRAKSYEGYFQNGFRYGQGTVKYEGGYRAEGTYYGAWQTGKTVFEGILYFPDGDFQACRMVCKSDETVDWLPR